MTREQDSTASKIYHLRIQGSLDPKWADWFDGFVMASRDDQESVLSGRVTDQAALHGVLARIRSLGLPLRLAVQTNCPRRKTKCAQHCQCAACYEHHAARGGLPFCLREKSRWDKQCNAMIS
jgi:hypothetical protein